jgi:hypothetical protein
MNAKNKFLFMYEPVVRITFEIQNVCIKTFQEICIEFRSRQTRSFNHQPPVTVLGVLLYVLGRFRTSTSNDNDNEHVIKSFFFVFVFVMHIKRVSTESSRKSRLDSKGYLHVSGINHGQYAYVAIPNNSNNQIVLHFKAEHVHKSKKMNENYVCLERTKMEADPR